MSKRPSVVAPLLAVFVCAFIRPPASAGNRTELRGMLRAARRYADEDALRTKEPEVRLLLAIAEEQYRAGVAEDARATLAAATAAVRGGGPCPVSGILVEAARVQWEVGSVAESSATMKAVLAAGLAAERKSRRECLESLAELQTDIGNLDGAMATAALTPGARKTEIYGRLAEAFAKAGRLDDAVAAYALTSPLPTEEEKRFFRLSHAPGASRWDAAEAAVAAHPEYADRWFESIAEGAALAGDFKTADKAVARVKAPASYFVETVALSHARHGDIHGALALIDSKLSKDPDGRAMGLLRVAVVQERMGDSAGAAETRSRALKISEKGQPAGHRNRLFLALALEGRGEEALALWKDPERLSPDYAVNELIEEGRVDVALRIAEAVGFGGLEHVAQHNVLAAYARKGDLAGLDRAFSSGVSGVVVQRDEWLEAVAETQARTGDMDAALKTLARLDDGPFTRRPSAVEHIAEAQTRWLEWSSPPDWIVSLRFPDEKARAWLGAARGMRLHQELLRR